MPTASDYFLYGILIVIAILLAVAILVMLRRSRHGPAENDTVLPPTSSSQGSELSDPTAEEESQIDPLELFLTHLRANSRTVEALGSNAYLVMRDSWSLPATFELAQMSVFIGQHDDEYQPSMRLLFEYSTDGSWSLSDQGENARMLHGVTDRFREELDAFRPQMSGLEVTLSLEGILSTYGSSYDGFADSLRDISSAVERMDDHWSPLIWESAGPLPFAVSAEGRRFEYGGSGIGYQSADSDGELTNSFTLNRGVMVVYFQHTGGIPKGDDSDEVTLVRDDPGLFDEPMSLCSFKGSDSLCGMWRVAEGRWRDPHPDLTYHLKVRAAGDWNCVVFQPDLGQAKGNFPHRFGIEGGANVAGPFRTGPRPVRVNIQHSGTGQFSLQFVSLDGSHEFVPEYSEHVGQLHLEDQDLGLLPGKEYLVCGWGDGSWNVELVEGY